MFNAYGPTEATVASNISDPLVAGDVITVGGPIRGVTTYVLDSRLGPVPEGVAGELYIAGAGIARGYHARSGLTAERFIANPYSEIGERIYRTGDLVRWVPGARTPQIEYVGRSDFQVKIRGFRIELGEIEDRLLACADVAEAVVVARPSATGDQRLVAYVVPAAGTTISASRLRDALARSLAEFMIPSAFVTLTALPLTPNGKLDRQALPAPDDSAVITRSYSAPVNDAERQMASIWQSLLGLARVGRDDHFFELGGN